MELQLAIHLVEYGVEKAKLPQVWADLGAGTGLFTKALAQLLAPGSVIHAIDRDASALSQIGVDDSVRVEKINKDFTGDVLGTQLYDGILLANALHYVEDARSFLSTLRQKLQVSGRLIIVEYERTTPNQWVPYPVSFNRLEKLAEESGFKSVARLGKAPSAYHSGGMFSALVLR